MYCPRKKPSRKTIIYAGMIFLLVSLMVAALVNLNTGNGAPVALDVAFGTTPSPNPLPTQSYKSASFFTTLFGQVFAKKTQLLDPSQITNDGQLQTENEYLDLYSVNSYLPADTQWWQEESKQVYEYVSKRVDETIPEKVIVAFTPPRSGNCAARGTTFYEQPPVILIFADEDTRKEQILAVLAHELGHVFIHKKYENLSDLALNEGIATWAAGNYWRDWKGVDFNSGVKSFVEDETYLPLFQNYYLEKAYDDNSPDCIINRDILLTEIASFLDYLIQTYGTEQLFSLFHVQQPELVGNQRVVYPPKFKDIYGLEFNQLEYEWLESLLQSSQ